MTCRQAAYVSFTRRLGALKGEVLAHHVYRGIFQLASGCARALGRRIQESWRMIQVLRSSIYLPLRSDGPQPAYSTAEDGANRPTKRSTRSVAGE